ncbi:hypothetical protein MMC32_005231 [Xylographa parallela]|nr:hypothetical protein [Xylographa parallela]
MPDLTSTRKSARGRVPNKKYSNDAFEILDILESDSDVAAEPVPNFDNSDVDKDFESDKAAEEHDEDKESGGTSDVGSDGTGIATPVEAFEDALSYASDVDLLERGEDLKPLGSSSQTLKRVRAGSRKVPEEDWHFRGIHWNGKTKEAHVKYLVGTNPQDMADYVRARDKWVQLATLPTRVPDQYGTGGMALPVASSESSRSTQASADWDWYYCQGGKRKMEERQRVCSLSLNDSSRYVLWSQRQHSFLMGPYGNQTVHSLASLETLSIPDAWSSTSVPRAHSNKEKVTTTERNGWMLNAGAKVSCLDWAPNHPSHIQYLAISISQSPPPDTKQHTPFEPSESYSTSFQLWAFQAANTPGSKGMMDMTRAPELAQIVCTDWGALRQFRWCPAPREAHDSDEQGRTHVGLLAGVWSDAYVRVLDIQLENVRSSPSIYTTELAVGCANGFVAIWDIAESILSTPTTSMDIPMSQSTASPSSSNTPPRPRFYHYMHHSYILSLVSTYPSHPHYLVSASVDGYLRLTDVRNPAVDFVLSPRSRMLNSAIDFHPHTLSFMHSEDNEFLHVLPLRRFFTVIFVGKVEGTVLSLAVGKVHPCVLVASADGTVLATNPMRKVMGPKQKQYQQIWFRHEWAPKPQPLRSEGDEGTQGVSTSDEDRHVTREGMSRITEGYKVETVELQKSSKAKSKSGTAIATIYEEESAVTQVAWNPNLHCGGWAAAGTGCGLVRVEDLAI